MKHLMKTFALIFALCLFCVNADAQKVTLTSGNVNLRYAPSMNAGILSDYYGNHIHYSRGTSFTYAGQTRNGFYSIYVNGDILWVSSQFARMSNGGYGQNLAPRQGRHGGGKSLVINGTDVNFRLGPSLNAGVLSDGYGYHIHVPKYTRLPFLGTSGNFYKTRYNGRTVYVHMQYAYTE